MGVPLAAVVLAGGASRRMGRDKATMRHPVDSQTTMVQHCVALVSTRCAPVFVVAAPGQRLPVLDATILRDEVPGLGPLAAAGLGLRAAAEAGVDRAFVCAVDMPHLTGELIDLLAADRGGDIVLPWDGREHYLAGVYRTALAGRVDELIKTGARSMRSLTDGVVTRRVTAADPRALTNINTPDDLHRPDFCGDGCG